MLGIQRKRGIYPPFLLNTTNLKPNLILFLKKSEIGAYLP